jgi:myxalamid-type polyketide synthase MxaB
VTAQRDILKRSLDAIDALTAKLAASEARLREPVAVVGMSCRLPGGVTTPAQYWSLLRDGRSGIREIPGDRWDVEAYYDADPKAPGKMYTKYGGFLEQIDRFDASFFGIAPREAIMLDPQHRLLLECAWESLEDAGEAPDRLVNSATGVYVGITTSDYARIGRRGLDEADVYSASGTALNAAAGRISFALGLQGPCMAIDTACSSSLTAAHTAVQALRARECDLALVGGVNVIASPDAFVLFSRWGMIAPGAECRTFDAGANGFVRGEGCGVLVLRRLSDALADGSRILAVIRGSAVNQDGPSSGLSVPNGLAQAKVIRQALDNAGLQPNDVSFVEAHGTGTVLGDPIEVEALGMVYGPGRPAETPLMIGSVKPSIGHLESASGVAGLMKLVLAVQYGELPPQRNFGVPNPRIDWDRYPIRVVESLSGWPSGRNSRIGAVSGFGFSGTNVHMIVESPPASHAKAAQGHGAMSAAAGFVLPISARSDVALRESAGRLAAALAEAESPALPDVARTLSLGRSPLPHRAVVVGLDRATLQRRLTDVARNESSAGTHVATTVDRTSPRLAFLYTGQGSQYPGMGLGLRRAFPVFRTVFDECDALLQAQGGPALVETLERAGDSTRIHDTVVTQPALFALEYALTELLRSWGVAPATVMGHSVGEYAAACVAGVMSLEHAVHLVAERGRLMQALPTGGGMLAVAADEDTARRAASAFSDRVSIAAVNGPTDVVLSGDKAALQRIADNLRDAGVDNKPLTVSHAFHSPLMDPMLSSFAALAARVPLHPPRLPLISNLSGRVDASAGTTAEYWRRHAREPVAFEASMRQLVTDGFRVFLEIGPRPVLVGMARRFLHAEELTWVPTLRARASEAEDLLATIGTLFTVGAHPDWERILDGAGQRVALPTYPFQRKRFWIGEGVPALPAGTAASPAPVARADDHPFLGRRIPSPMREAQFECVLDPSHWPVLLEHRVDGIIIVPAAVLIELGQAAGHAFFGETPVRLEGGFFRNALVLDDARPRTLQLVVTPIGDDRADFELFSRASDGAENWEIHAGGQLVRELTILEAESPCAVGGDGAVDVGMYQLQMHALGLDYGPSFRALTAAWRGEGEARGELRLPPGDTLASRLLVHPGMLDAAFHLIGLALPSSDPDRFFLPVGYEQLDLVAPVGVEARAHVRIRSSDRHRVVADVSIWRPDGEPALHVGGLQVVPVTRAQFRAAIGEPIAAPLLRTEWRELATDASVAPREASGHWLVVGGTDALADAVAADLLVAGGSVECIRQSDVASLGERLHGGAWVDLRGIIDLRTMALADLAQCPDGVSSVIAGSPFEDVLTLLRQLASMTPLARLRLVMPTVCAQAVTMDDVVEPLATMVWGVAATAAAELPWLDIRVVDVERVAATVPIIAAAALRDDHEERLASRGTRLFAPRFVPLAQPRADALRVPAGAYALRMHDRGALGGLDLEPVSRRAPGATQVEIEVLASGLNFRDVLNLLDLYPGPAGPLGNECCGRVLAVGDAVSGLGVGDLVMCIAESTFASHVVADASMTFRVPSQLSQAQAAAFPIAQLTAWLALHQVGKLRAGDRVLIHAGAGGVGLAAVHLALAAGADVLASAGSDEKRTLLASLGVRVLFDSRRPPTAVEVRAATDGYGVDLLVNSLTGEAIDAGLRSLAPGGRFLEIGLRELRSDDQVRAIRDDVSYHALLLGDVCRDAPDTVRAMFDGLCALLADGRIPAPRVRSYSIEDSNTAFSVMAKARHIGRVVITHPARGVARARHDAAYLVTGGLGALGLHVAEWLAAQGAGQIVLMGRSMPSAEALTRMDALRQRGVEVDLLQGDVSSASALKALATVVRRPLRGFVHAAGVVDDAVLSRVDAARMATALRPKADGALNLLAATADTDLDWAVFFSSGSALLGSPGQAAYAGANAFLDGLAHRVRREGRVATSINWGAWGGTGMAAKVDERTAREWAARGIRALPVEEAMTMLDASLSSHLAQVVAVPIVWSKFLAAMPVEQRPALFAELAPVPEAPRDLVVAATVTIDFRESLLALPARDRPSALTDRLRREVSAVLGVRDPDDLEWHAGLMEQGMDSLMAVDLSGRLARALGVALPSTFAFDHPTLAALSRHLLGQLLPPEVPEVPAMTATTGGTLVSGGDVHGLSDADLEAELRRELDQAGF